eukprot:762545-Hanusia_phi.AAC.4
MFPVHHIPSVCISKSGAVRSAAQRLLLLSVPVRSHHTPYERRRSVIKVEKRSRAGKSRGQESQADCVRYGTRSGRTTIRQWELES